MLFALSIKNKTMNKEKKSSNKKGEHHSLMEMAGEKAGAIKDSIIEGKNKIISAAEEKLESVKKAIHDYTAPAKKVAKKNATKTIKKVAKKVVKKVAKKLPKKK